MILSLNHPAVEVIRFPDGQAHVRVGLEVPTTVDIEQRIRNDGTKNSLRGLIWVGEEGGQIVARDGVSWDEEACGLLQTVWQDSTFRRQDNIRDIRARLRKPS